VLPKDEGMQAVEACEVAALKCESALDIARLCLKSLSVESKKLSKEANKQVTDELVELRSRGEETEKKLKAFRRETLQRKTKALLHEVSELVAEAESQVQTMSEVVKLLCAETLDEVSTESLRSALEQSAVAGKDATTACSTAQALLRLKQKDAKDAPLVAELTKLNSRLTAAQRDLQKNRQSAQNGERAIKGKEVLLQEEAKTKEAEAAVEKMETLATPLGDEKPNDEAIAQIDVAVKEAQAALSKSATSLDSQMAGASPPLKGSLSKLVVRAKKAQEKIDSVKASTRVQREKVSAEAFALEAEKKVEAVEAALLKVNEAELPFLKGIEVLPLKEATAIIEESESAAKLVQQALDESQTFVASRTLEIRKFAEDVAKPALERLQASGECNNAASQKLSQFRRDTDGRKRNALMQQAGELLANAECEVERTKEAAAPLATEDLSSITAELATEICEKLASLEKSAQQRMEEARAFLSERQKDVRGHAPHEEELKKLQAKLQSIKAQLTEAKKAASQQEQRFVARKLLSEAGDMVSEVEADVEKVGVAAEPLLKDNGAGFLVQASVQRLAKALQEQIARTGGFTRESLFRKACNGDGPLTETAFKAFVTGLGAEVPEGSEGAEFSEAQQLAMFKSIDADASGDISLAELEEIFRERFVCVHNVSMTDASDITSGKTILKMAPNTVIEALGPPEVNPKLSVTRLHCRLVEGQKKEGWVTLQGNQGTMYFEPFSPHGSCIKTFERILETTAKAVSKTSAFLALKRKELASCTQGPLAEAKGKMSELQTRGASRQKQLDQLRTSVAQAKKEYARCEEEELKAQREARDRKASAAITKAVAEHLEALEAEAKRLAEAVAPLLGAEVEAVESPLALLSEGKRLCAAVASCAADARTALEKQQVTKAMKGGPLADAKLIVAKALVKVDTIEKKAKHSVEVAQEATKKVSAAALTRVAQAFRDDAQQKGTTLEALFPSEEISKEAFERKLTELPGLSVSPEQASLMFSHHLNKGEATGGVSRQNFLRAMQLFYVCVRPIAVTQ
ncbi:unnamed protein product, partial [Polarella glacialis]